MNKKLLQTMAIVACSVTCATTVGFGVATSLSNAPGTASAAEIVLDSSWVEDRDYGSLFTVPMGDIDGVRANEFKVTSPTGKIYSAQAFTLTETGLYTVEWSTKVNGKVVTATKTFCVTKNTLSIEGNGMLKPSDSSAFPNPTSGSYLLEMDSESTFVYNKPINLNELWTEDTSPSAATPIAKVFPHRGVKNILEAESKAGFIVVDEGASNYVITLTDCYDPTNYITIDMEWKDTDKQWYFRANAAGQKAYGLTRDKKAGTILCEEDGEMYKSSSAGAKSGNATQGGQSTIRNEETGETKNNGSKTDGGIEIKYDPSTKCVWMEYATLSLGQKANETTGVMEFRRSFKTYRRPIAYLANTSVYPRNPFKGFTTGDVYLSITYKNIAGDYGYMDITSLGGETLSAEMLNSKERDTVAPTIAVNEAFEKGQVFVATNEEVSVPDASVFDASLPRDTKATATVYYGTESSSSPTLIPLTNGKFTPTRTGNHMIVYTAKDTFGNETRKVVNITAKAVSGNVAVKLALKNDITEVGAGTTLAIPGCTITGLYTDESALKVYANGKLVENGELFLDEIGTYNLEYVYETPFKTYTLTDTFTAQGNGDVAFTKPILPEYFIANAKYTLDPVMAQAYTAAKPAPVVADVYMKADNGSYTKVDFDSVQIPSNAQKVQFKYSYDGDEAVSDPIKVINTGFGSSLKQQEYFYSEEDAFAKSSASTAVTYTLNPGVTTATMKYINALSFYKFAMQFTPTNIHSITFTLVDYYDRSNKLTYTIKTGSSEDEESSKYIDVLINGEEVKYVKDTTFLDANTLIKYESGAFSLKVGPDVLSTNDYKSTFTSDKVLFWITTEGTEGGSLAISRVFDCLQFSSVTTDKVTPVVRLNEYYTGWQTIGREVVISKATVTDVFAPFLKSGLSFKATYEDGTPLRSVDGVLLDGTCSIDREYRVKLDRIGRFEFWYTYSEQASGTTDANYKTTRGGFHCTVRDSIAPTISVSGIEDGAVFASKLGSKIAVATYTVSDNVCDVNEIKSYVYVTWPSGLMMKLQGGKSFLASEKGTYTVVYFAYDLTGNCSSVMYSIIVS